MSSEYKKRTAEDVGRLLASMVMVCLLVTTAHCGKKGPPKPPPSKIPSAINDLTVQQRGLEMILRMTYPSTTIGGLPLENLEAIEISEMKRIIPAFSADTGMLGESPGDESATDFVQDATDDGEDEGGEGQEPESTLVEDIVEAEEPDDPDEGLLFRAATEQPEEDVSKEDQIEVDPREFDLVARLSWRAEDTELDSAILGDAIVAHVPIAEITEVEEIHVFGARVIASEKLVSATSNLVKILPRVPPAPPEDLAVEPSQVGIKITWSAPDPSAQVETTVDEETEDDVGFEGFNVYRRNANVREYGLPIFISPETVEAYTDTSAAFDSRYIYTVTTILSKDPLIESAVGAEYEVNYQDRFAPEPPREVAALPETSQVRLLWERSVSEDVVGYRVYRKDPGGDFLLITPELVAGSEYLDQELSGGQIYSYFVVAVDSAENQSEASTAVDVRVP